MKTTSASPGNFHHYNRRLKERSRKLRSTMTQAEKVLWEMLRKKRIYNCTFTRQRPVLDYIADFMCKEILLIIETDGITHLSEEQKAKDQKRDADLSEAGFTIMRFYDGVVLHYGEEVRQEISKCVEKKLKEKTINQ